MKYAYEDLSPEQFEKLIVFLCQKLLGVSVQSFSKGPDGGRDAKFVGTAELHPSKAAPWIGIVIIQAKHTNGYNKHFLESDFFSSKNSNSVIQKEIPRIKRLRDMRGLDHYMLFANRKLAGNAESEIRLYIASECNLPVDSIYICGVEQLENFLVAFPEVAENAKLNPLDSPLIISPDELAIVIQAFAKHRNVINDVSNEPPVPRVSYEQKNTINNMSATYAKAQRIRYLKETPQIRSFLAAPENYDLRQTYEIIVDEFNFKIIAKRQDYHSFDEVMEYLLELLFNRDPILRKHKSLTRAMLFYMYWNCDIGEVDNATAE